MNTDASAQSMVSIQEVDENMAQVQKNVSLIIDVHQNEINKLKKQLQEEQERNSFYVHGFKELCEKYEGDGEWSFAEVELWIDNLEDEKAQKEAEEEEIIENYFANMKLRETTWKEWNTIEEENKKLKEENKELNEEAEQNQQLFDTTFGELMKLKEENEKLKEQLDEQYSFSYFKQVKELTAENKKLKEEILLIGKRVAEKADITEPHRDTILRLMNADDEVIGNHLCVLAEIKYLFDQASKN